MVERATAPLRLVFCGTPQFAVPTLEALIAAGHSIALALTQPDRPVGRKQVLTAPPVKVTAQAHGIEVMQPEKIKNNLELRERLEAIQPDAIVVVAYGRIIPKWMLDLPRLGCINLHGSLLPKYRGAAPIQWAVADGEAVTGNTTMLLAEGLDTGPILLQQEMPISPEQTAVDLFHELSIAGAPLVVETLARLADGTIQPVAQEDSLATVARILDREDGRMDFAARTATQLWNRWRGFQPWPGAFTTLHEKKFIVTRMKPVKDTEELDARQIRIENGRFLVGCAGQTVLEFLEIQPEGRNRMTAAEFLRGAGLASGVRLG